jgi:hypothetical protein
VCRLLDTMDAQGYVRCVPRRPAKIGRERPFIELASGYVKRAAARLPKQLDDIPFRAPQNYFVDLPHMRFGRVIDGFLEFSRAEDASALSRPPTAAGAAQAARA